MKLRGLQEFFTLKVIAYPNCVTERSVKHRYILDDKGKVSYQKISSSNTIKTRQVVIQKVGQEVSREKPTNLLTDDGETKAKRTLLHDRQNRLGQWMREIVHKGHDNEMAHKKVLLPIHRERGHEKT